MGILVIAATPEELGICRDAGASVGVDYRVTGIGSPSTIYSLMHLLSNPAYQFVVQAGIAGSYSASFPVGTIAEITSDCFADLGYDDRGHFVPATRAGWIAPDQYPYSGGFLRNRRWFASKNIPEARGLTVNTVSGSKERIEQLTSLFHGDLETMETAALFWVCLRKGIPFVSLRAVSNLVEPRNKEAWDISAALQNLSVTFGEFFGDPDICCKYITHSDIS
ncbi:MAG: futalosine hydrolase [Bacteroidales bacterium]|nr:futalosine hydrolase [Bacteroidales bacterium]